MNVLFRLSAHEVSRGRRLRSIWRRDWRREEEGKNGREKENRGHPSPSSWWNHPAIREPLNISHYEFLRIDKNIHLWSMEENSLHSKPSVERKETNKHIENRTLEESNTEKDSSHKRIWLVSQKEWEDECILWSKPSHVWEWPPNGLIPLPSLSSYFYLITRVEWGGESVERMTERRREE